MPRTPEAPQPPQSEEQLAEAHTPTIYDQASATSPVLGSISEARAAKIGVGPEVIGSDESETKLKIAMTAINQGIRRENVGLEPKEYEPKPHQQIGISLKGPDYTIPERPGQAGSRKE